MERNNHILNFIIGLFGLAITYIIGFLGYNLLNFLFNGDIAKVRVYSDTLTSSEVSTNYNAEKSYFGHT